MKTIKNIIFFVFLIGMGFTFSVPCQAASLFHKEDFEDNNKMDTFGADSSDRLNCLLNSSWVITNSYQSYGQTVTAVSGNHFLGGNWKPGVTDDYGNCATCSNNRLRMLDTAPSGGASLGYDAHIQSEFFIRFYIRVTGPIPLTGYNADPSIEQSTFKLMYMYPGNTCIEINPSNLDNQGSWDVYSAATPLVRTADPRPPLRDHAWHKIEIYVKIGSSGHVTLWCDDVVRWDGTVNVSKPSDIGLMYNDGTKGFFDWDAPWFLDDLEFYVDTGTDYPNSSLRDGTIGEKPQAAVPPGVPSNLALIN